MNNFELMKQRIEFVGDTFQKRIIQGKASGFESALKNGSNTQTVIVNSKESKVLINDNKLTQNYDEKIISAPHDLKLKTGDIVYWKETNSYWIVYLQDISELAYSNAYMRKCHNETIVRTSVGKTQVRAAVFGNEDALIQSVIKSKVSVDTSKLTIQLLIPNTKENLELFKRYNKFMFNSIPWEINGVNSIDLENILIIIAQEDTEFIEDTPIENEDVTAGQIQGKLVIKPLEIATYTVSEAVPTSSWSVDHSNVSILDIKNKEITIKWTDIKSGEFVLSYGDYSQKIIVESLF